MPHGWVGKLLRVDLTKRETVVEQSEQYYKDFLGGKGVNAKLIWDEVPPATDSLSPEARLAVASAPMVGTLAPTASKLSITAKSPVTGIYGDTNIGGAFSPALKYAGFDQIVFTGKADKPVYLFLNDGKAELRDASHLWGKDVGMATKTLKQELAGDAGSRYIQTISIGPAGENQVVSASIASWPSGSASRTGMGAVMGSKNLKAIAAAGTGTVTVAKPTELFELCGRIAEGTKKLREVVQDTAGEITHHAEYLLYGVSDSLPPDGWPGPEGLLSALREFFAKYGSGLPTSCMNCPSPCKPAFKIPDPNGSYDYTVLHCDTWLMFTTRTKSIEFDFVKDSQIYMQCQKLGIDIFSATSDVAFLIELFERGIINEKDTDGLILKWNDRDIILPIIEKIARKEGIGALFQRGIKGAAKQIGKGAEEYVYDTHGLELVHYPLYLIDAALGGAISQRKDQVRAHSGTLLGFSAAPKEFLQMVTSQLPKDVAESVLKDGYITRYKGKAGLVEHFERINSIADLVGQCRWWMGGVMLVGILTPESRAQMLSYITGREYTAEELDLINERVETLIRAFNLREGLRKKDDTIPKFYFQDKSPKYGFKLDEKKFDKVLVEYYRMRGWDDEGVPRKDRLKVLGLNYVEKDLKKRNIMK